MSDRRSRIERMAQGDELPADQQPDVMPGVGAAARWLASAGALGLLGIMVGGVLALAAYGVFDLVRAVVR